MFTTDFRKYTRPKMRKLTSMMGILIKIVDMPIGMNGTKWFRTIASPLMPPGTKPEDDATE